MAVESGRGPGLFRTHLERPERRHRSNGCALGGVGVRLRPVGRRDVGHLERGGSNGSPGGEGEDLGEEAEGD